MTLPIVPPPQCYGDDDAKQRLQRKSFPIKSTCLFVPRRQAKDPDNDEPSE
jgi:hypothetical protein